MDFDNFKEKTVLILGLGREGVDSLLFLLKNCPAKRIGVADKREFINLDPEIKQLLEEKIDIERFFGLEYLKGMAKYDIIIKSPGVPIHIPEVESAFNQGRITSQTELFFKNCPGTLIGVTGTKGKSTTSSIIFDILKKAGKKANLVGNIGVPMLSFLGEATKDDYFVCELSAHQLYRMSASPHISVLLNIYSEHLDYYKDLGEYIQSKANIAIHQKESDYLIYNSGSIEVNEIAERSKAKKIAFNEYKWEFKGKTALIGKFNLENAKIGAIVGHILGISDEVISNAISEFKPLEHRLEFVGNFKGVDCYNDSLSTIQESAVAAIDGLGNRVQTLVAGGFDRNQPFDKLAVSVLNSDIANLVLFPTTGIKIWDEIRKQANINNQEARLLDIKASFVNTMGEAAELILKDTALGRICLLSAASASFSNFKDYSDRGKAFKESLALAALTRK